MENNKREAPESDQEEDEMKMEEFYSLLRSFRNARDRRRRELEKDESKSKKMKPHTPTTTPKPQPEVSFQFQDFTTEIHFRKPPLLFPNPIPCDTTNNNNAIKKNEQQHDLALDLKLAL
ncbi:uncharacterized protein LOC109807610 [Cajanus cajan]|uniref:Protein NIM1-INTERACTING 1 n=1 Tax=Cajanus cajan TaxID=3821 RepID=A0A151SMU0_CAJCA|nr:uncharacterized protein LOC109807610 [Cajanus cajan]KYP56137.1 hypothetical protein KK1_002371 [Cajanus cajan]